MRSLKVTEGARWMNHFHDPIHNSGLWWGVGDSAIEWAFEPKFSQSYLTGNFSYHDVTNYFYKALTSQAEYDRQYYYTQTFRGLGQLMHLVQDMSVPAHVRNDAHPLSAAYEAWFVENGGEGNPLNLRRIPDPVHGVLLRITNCENIYGVVDTNWPAPYLYLPNDIPFVFFDSAALESATPHPLSDDPVSNLFDADIYDEDSKGNPELTVRGDAGLSEYTNANFLSPDSLFAYKYPKLITLDEDPMDPASIKLAEVYDQHDDHYGKFYKKFQHGEQIDYFARVLRINKFIPDLSTECQVDPTLCQDVTMPELGFTLDDPRVHANYAQKLIPRAVGYSSQLLSYFFEKHLELLEISVPDDGFYAMTTDPEVGFNSIKLRVRNKSQQVEFTDGEITLVVKYKVVPEGCEILMADPDNILDPGNCYPSDIDFQQIIVSCPSIREIPNESPLELQFDLGTETIPLNAVDVHFYVLYKGQGCRCEEEPCTCQPGSVAFGYKDVSEPTSYAAANLMDWVCIEIDGSKNWYEAGSNEAILARDAVGGNVDIYPHNLENIYIRFSPDEDFRRKTAGINEGEYHAFIDAIPSGRYAQNIFLLSEPRFWASYHLDVVPTDPADTHDKDVIDSGHSVPGRKYQIDLNIAAQQNFLYLSKYNKVRGVWIFNGFTIFGDSYPYMHPSCETEGCYCPKDDYDYNNDIIIKDTL